MNSIVTVNFHGAEIYGFRSGDLVLIAIKPIVTAMGLDWPSQHKRIKRDPVLSEGVVMMTIPFGPGGAQTMVCLDLERVHGWLFRIDSSRIKNLAVRERVEIYQRECYRVLYKHFSGDRNKLAREENETTSLKLQIVRETRHIWGNWAAAEQWDKQGLPKVRRMDQLFRQLDMFEEADRREAA